MTEKKEEGIIFPGDGSTTNFGKGAFAAAALAGGNADLQNRILSERNWRYRYTSYVLEEVRLACTSPDVAFKMAEAGLDYLHKSFEFNRNGKILSLEEAMKSPEGDFYTATILGSRQLSKDIQLSVPYNRRTLRGQELLAQIERWKSYGTIEPGCAEALQKVAQNPAVLDLSKDYFVLLGAASAMGPYSILMELGANVIALDLDRPGIWKKLISIARETPGTLIFPTKKPQSELTTDDDLFAASGCNLTTNTPEILRWLLSIVPDKPLIVGNYAYLDGERHVRVSIAADAIMKGLSESRKNVTLAFLNTPTHAYVISEEASRAARRNYNTLSLLNLFLYVPRLLAGKKYLAKNALPEVNVDSKTKYFLCDGLVVAQGPNYALPKCLQHWRAILSQKNNIRVSSNIAPSTATASVVHNQQFAWAYGGFHNFVPMEIFQQETSNAVMAALLIHDVRYTTGTERLSNPWLLFARSPFHGGVWRTAYKISSIGEVSAGLYFLNKFKIVLFILLVLIVALLFWLLTK